MMKPKIIHKSGMKSITSSAGEDGPNALLELPVPDSQENTSLLRGYNATAPESLTPRLRRRRLRSSLSKKQALHSVGISKAPNLPPSELNRQSAEILVDKQNIEVRREILNKEITGVEEKIRVLEEVKEGLERELLGLREEELELEDECESTIHFTSLTRADELLFA
jgi:division protein 1